MKTIEIKLEINPNSKELYLLNRPFQNLMDDENFTIGRVSSYHQEHAYKCKWPVYKHPLPFNTKIIIVKSDTALSIEEMEKFVAQHNGIGMTRDNLFSMYALYKEKLHEHFKKSKKIKIVAYCEESKLPKHENGPTIMPALELEYHIDLETIKSIDYDWIWTDNPRNTPIHYFTFFEIEMSL